MSSGYTSAFAGASASCRCCRLVPTPQDSVTVELASLFPTIMFKTAATKIAHNSTIPALGGNQDLRPLQDLITAEKALLTS